LKILIQTTPGAPNMLRKVILHMLLA
jgi:hypothetical protein